MFEHIAEEFQWRLKDLKSELEKRLDIRYKNESNNESDNESEDELEDESKKKSMENLTKFNPNLVFDAKSGKIMNSKSDGKLKVIAEENESESDSNVKNKTLRYFGPPDLKLKPGDTLNGFRILGPHNPVYNK